MSWPPSTILRVLEVRETSTRPLRLETDVGTVFAKLPTYPNPIGPHALASDMIGLRLAEWLGLTTLQCAVLWADALDLPDGTRSQRGDALLTREVTGQTWGGDEEQLDALENAHELAGLVLVDTWIRNHDRYRNVRGTERKNLENVFFAHGAADGRLRLTAIDFTECVRQGSGSLQRSQCGIDQKRDPIVYGLFPQFRARVLPEHARPFLDRLATFSREVAQSAVQGLPASWDVSAEIRAALVDFLVERAEFVARNGLQILGEACGWQQAPSSDIMSDEREPT